MKRLRFVPAARTVAVGWHTVVLLAATALAANAQGRTRSVSGGFSGGRMQAPSFRPAPRVTPMSPRAVSPITPMTPRLFAPTIPNRAGQFRSAFPNVGRQFQPNMPNPARGNGGSPFNRFHNNQNGAAFDRFHHS